MRFTLALSLAVLPLVACAPDAVGSSTGTGTGTDSGSGSESSGSESTTGMDTVEPTDTVALTDTDESESGDDPSELPPLVGDNCELEVLWSRSSEDGVGGDRFDALEVAGPGAFVLGGLDENGEAHKAMLMGVEGGETVWTTLLPPALSYGSQFVRELSVAEDGTVFALITMEDYGRTLLFSGAGEQLELNVQFETLWEDMVRTPQGVRAVGRSTQEVDGGATVLANFDALGMLLDLVPAPTVGISVPDQDWAKALAVDGERSWVAGWDDNRCAVLIEYDLLGIEQWWTCLVSGEGGEGRVTGLELLPNGNLVMTGSARVSKNFASYREPWIAAATREGEPVWEWRPGPDTTYKGALEDMVVTEAGDVIAVYGERQQGPKNPVLWRRDQDGGFVGRCHLDRPGLGFFEWDAALLSVALDADEEIYVLLSEDFESLDERIFSLLHIQGFE